MFGIICVEVGGTKGEVVVGVIVDVKLGIVCCEVSSGRVGITVGVMVPINCDTKLLIRALS